MDSIQFSKLLDNIFTISALIEAFIVIKVPYLQNFDGDQLSKIHLIFAIKVKNFDDCMLITSFCQYFINYKVC